MSNILMISSTYSPLIFNSSTTTAAKQNRGSKMQTAVVRVCCTAALRETRWPNKSHDQQHAKITLKQLRAGAGAGGVLNNTSTTPAAAAASVQQDIRPLGNFTPCIWGDHFSSLSFDDKEMVSEAYVNEIEGYKEQVRGMLMDAAINSMEKINLINSLYRLGLSYHFENEIDGLLNDYFSDFKLDVDKEYDLYTISMQFQLFRQHGFKMSCDENGNFNESLASDVKGMLSLYEASQIRIRGEDVLEEALAFTKNHLTCIAADHSHHLSKQAARVLEQSSHRGIPRVESRIYISFYEEYESHNDMILRFAKLDYNLIQLAYKKELILLSRWSKDLNFPNEVWYGRDRVVECHLFSVAFLFEPRYSLARIILTKIIVIGTYIDDAYDSFGTFEELQLFQDAIDRWDISCTDQLPDYMKFLYIALLDIFDELDEEMAKYGRSYAVEHTKEAMKEMCGAFYQLAKCIESNHIPSYDEYNKIAFITAAVHIFAATTFLGMPEHANEETFKWLQGQPKIRGCAELLTRQPNDLVDREFDQRNGRVLSSIECYKEQYGVSEDEAIEEIRQLVTDAWKDLNEEYLKPSVVPLRILRVFVNYAGSVDVVYKFDNGFNKPELIKAINTLLFVDPVPI